jgi:DNA polymerase III delta prime subunit
MSNYLVIGRRGTGKSTLADAKARELNPHQIFFDPGDQFQSAVKHVSNTREFAKLMEQDQGAPGDFHASDWPRSIAYVPPSSHVDAEWDAFAAKLWEYTGQHEGAASYCLVVDEAHELQSPQTINDWLARYIRRAPRREREDRNPVDMIQTTHNPQDLNRLTFSQTDKVYIFNMFDKRALKAISDQFGDEVAQEVTQLRTPKRGGRDVLEIDAETGEYQLLDNPADWFVNIREAQPDPELDDRMSKNLEELYGRN